MSVTAEINVGVEAVETDNLGLDLATVAQITHILRQRQTLGGTSTPVVSQIWTDEFQLTAGAHTIDLTALPSKAGSTLDLTGLKVQAIIVQNLSTNTGALRIEVGATNGYNIFGNATSDADIAQGGVIAVVNPEGTPDVGAAAKDVDLSSADTDLTVRVLILAG